MILHFFAYAFIQRAYLAGTCIAALCAMLGLFLVLRKLSLIGDGLSHVSFGAIAIGLFFGIYPLAIAIPIVIVASYAILKLSERTRMYGDAAIGIVSSVGIAVGVTLATLSSGFNVDIFSYLFGNILAISSSEVLLSVILSLIVLFVIIFFYNDLFSTAFDENYARVSGINTRAMNILLSCLTAVTVVLAIKVVGIMLVSALLILPAVTALQLAKGFRMAMISAVLFSILSVLIGITVSFFANIPAGASIILVHTVFFGGAYGWKKWGVGSK
ncbi:MAG: metal ABC transporter permease [Patescibacteria group bacterium]